MKTMKYLLVALATGSLMAACNTDIESLTIQRPLTYDDQYYQNLRDYKASDHEIAFGWFAQYGAQNSAAVRFMGLPDSLDICSMWGGIPAKENTEIWDEIRFVQKVKGTKMLCVAITRIDAETDEHDFKKAYNEAKAMPEGDERTVALNRSFEMYAEYFLDQVFLNDLDGFDADYEPEGDFLSGSNFEYFYKHMAKYMGPNPDITKEERLQLIEERYGKEIASQEGICDKMLNIDQTSTSMTSLVPYSNYCFLQAYSGGTGAGGWPDERWYTAVIWVTAGRVICSPCTIRHVINRRMANAKEVLEHSLSIVTIMYTNTILSLTIGSVNVSKYRIRLSIN